MKGYSYTTGRARIALVISAVVLFAFVLLGSGAFAGATFATGDGQAGIELTIDSEASYNGAPQPALSWSLKNLVPGVDRFFNFGDVKPGDYGENTVSMHIEKNPAYVCLDFFNLTSSENGINEPEGLVDVTPNVGELADGLEFFAWHDDGDNIFELGEKPMFGTSTQSASVVLASTTYPLADATTGQPFAVGSTHYFGITWCAGNLEVNLATAELSCDANTLGNEAQTDSMSVDVRLTAVQANEQPNFICDGGGGGGGGGGVEGCSPGYWKQPQHFGNWPAPYATNTLFSSVFEDAFPGQTLLQVVSQGGGGLNALGRQTVAALLNASSTDIGYLYTPAEVIAKINAAYPSSDYTTLKDELEHLNTVFCPLGNATNENTAAVVESTVWREEESKGVVETIIEKGKRALTRDAS